MSCGDRVSVTRRSIILSIFHFHLSLPSAIFILNNLRLQLCLSSPGSSRLLVPAGIYFHLQISPLSVMFTTTHFYVRLFLPYSFSTFSYSQLRYLYRHPLLHSTVPTISYRYRNPFLPSTPSSVISTVRQFCFQFRLQLCLPSANSTFNSTFSYVKRYPFLPPTPPSVMSTVNHFYLLLYLQVCLQSPICTFNSIYS